MRSKKKQFCPCIYAEWGELFDAITEKERSEILLAITKFPEYEPENVPIWNFIKSQLQKDYELFIEKCEKNGEISRNYWQNKKTNDIECNRTNTDGYPKLKHKLLTKTKTKTKTKTETKIKYGEFNNVKLADDEYNKLKELYANKLDDAINILSSYLASKGDKYKSHYAVLGKHNWVYKKIQENYNKKDNSYGSGLF